MKRTSFARWPCSIARTVDLLGDWWTPLVLREAFYGVHRFDDFQQSLGIGRNILAERLRRLVDNGLLERHKYQDRPERHEYRLTEKGRDFFPVLAAMMRWGDRWLDGGKGEPVTLRHTTCGQVTSAEIVCSECGEPLSARDVVTELGPGYPTTLRDHPAVQARFDTLSDGRLGR
jgi:DNA-binding HxlR family transcriptional regulator